MKSDKCRVSFQTGLIVSLILCLSVPAGSTQTEVWTVTSFEDFRRGELELVSLTEQGEMLVAPETTQFLALKNQTLLVWALVRDSKGNWYAGTGNEGKIFKIMPNGEVSVFFDSPEISILSLAVDATDNVYAGSAPDGLIYKITPEGGQTTFFTTNEHYVWSLVFDAKQTLYAGTGADGKIFQITPDGAGSVLYDSPQAHVMSVVYDAGDWLYAGTEGKGITYKVGLDGKAFALYDAEEEEIRALTRDRQGNLYIAAISSEFYTKAQPAAPIEQQEPRPKEKVTKKSSIYRISPAGTVQKILELPETLVYAMITDAQDHLLAGTDEKGGLYRIFPESRTYQHVLTVEAGNILTLAHAPDGQVYVGTGDKGAVYQLASKLAAKGTYLSPVQDVKTTVTWGKIFWRGTPNRITIQTRTGNTAVPDDTWSPWSEEFRAQEGAAIPNPAARFIQWQAILTPTPDSQSSPVLEEVSVTYVPHNLPPEIQQITIISPSQNEQQKQGTSNASATVRKPEPQKPKTPAPPTPEPGQITIAWEAADPNNESLEYTLALRGAEEQQWRTVKEELETPFYVVDTTMLADGGYYAKVTASDLPDNPPDRILTTEKTSERFEIDNTAPEISIALNQRQENDHRVQLTVIAQDAFSRLQYAEYALDGKNWTLIFPDDTVTDSREEKYTLTFTDVTPEEHLLVFRAADAHDNTGVGKFVFSSSLPTPVPTPTTKPEQKK